MKYSKLLTMDRNILYEIGTKINDEETFKNFMKGVDKNIANKEKLISQKEKEFSKLETFTKPALSINILIDLFSSIAEIHDVHDDSSEFDGQSIITLQAITLKDWKTIPKDSEIKIVHFSDRDYVTIYFRIPEDLDKYIKAFGAEDNKDPNDFRFDYYTRKGDVEKGYASGEIELRIQPVKYVLE